MCWFDFKDGRGYANLLLDVVWLLSAGVCWLALFSGVVLLVVGVTCGACELLALALGVFGGRGPGVFTGERGR